MISQELSPGWEPTGLDTWPMILHRITHHAVSQAPRDDACTSLVKTHGIHGITQGPRVLPSASAITGLRKTYLDRWIRVRSDQHHRIELKPLK